MTLPQSVQVWLDADFLPTVTLVGRLHHSNGTVRFAYDASWLASKNAVTLDPDLTLDRAPFYANAETGNFGVLMDSSPDRWGQQLMRKREAITSKAENRSRRPLHAWDYLLGVQDRTRLGALRFREDEKSPFIGAYGFATPQVADLNELADIACSLDGSTDDETALRQWLDLLFHPGSSLGGARPKANVTWEDDSLWIAKFPARQDSYDVAVWEHVAYQLAVKAGVEMAPSGLLKFGRTDYHTFCTARFDRVGDRRRFYTSAMTHLRKKDREEASYLEMADHFSRHGSPKHVKGDLEQLFRRVAFNVAVGNRDDHLRNHGFILTQEGLRLAPAFDVNPSPTKHDHALAIDDGDHSPDLDVVLSTAELYGLSQSAAKGIIDEVCAAVSPWSALARDLGMKRGDITMMQSAFSSPAAPGLHFTSATPENALESEVATAPEHAEGVGTDNALELGAESRCALGGKTN